MSFNETTAATDAGPIYSNFRDDEDFRELLEEFATAAAERRQVLSQSFAAGELNTVRVQAHQLKGAGGGYGFEELSARAAALEEACKRPTPSIDEIGPLLDRVIDILSRVRA